MAVTSLMLAHVLLLAALTAGLAISDSDNVAIKKRDFMMLSFN
jgi:hypothetical protein